MQERRSNADRRAETRAALIAAARALFVEKGYADTGTPDIVANAKVTRGALYHHFADKVDLFRAVVEAEAADVAGTINAAGTSPGLDGLLAGSAAYFNAMQDPGRARLMLIEGPAVLGPDTMTSIADAHDARTLREGLRAVGVKRDDLDAVVAMLSAAFDRAAFDISHGAEPERYQKALAKILTALSVQ